MRAVKFVIWYLLAIGVAGYAVFAYGFLPLGSVVHPDMKANFIQHSTGIYIHAFAAALAMLLGPLQFTTQIRERYTTWHRWLGRCYLGIGVLVGGLAGIYMAQFAYGGVMARLGFATLAIIWLYTGVRAYLAVRRGDIQQHHRWMIRNYALTFAAVTLRIYIPASMASDLEFDLVYPFIAWLCWLPNLVFVEWRHVQGQRSVVNAG